MLRAIVRVLLLCAVTAGIGHAGSESTSGQALLWRLQGSTTHYLFGTIHVPDPRVTTLPSTVKQALLASDIVLTEIKMDESTMIAAAQAMLLPPDQSLSQLLPTATKQALQGELVRINPQLSLAAFDRLKPWAFAASLPLLEMQLKYAGAPALDVLLAQKAKRNEGIETLDEQVSIFESMSQQQQIRLLDFTLREMQNDRSKGSDSIDVMIKTYLAGDEKALDELVNHWINAEDNVEDLKKRLLTDRNIIMAQRLDERLSKSPQQKLFVAVGAGHLVGNGNVLELLRQRGYKIERVK